jgi:hypothetical protein
MWQVPARLALRRRRKVEWAADVDLCSRCTACLPTEYYAAAPLPLPGAVLSSRCCVAASTSDVFRPLPCMIQSCSCACTQWRTCMKFAETFVRHLWMPIVAFGHVQDYDVPLVPITSNACCFDRSWFLDGLGNPGMNVCFLRPKAWGDGIFNASFFSNYTIHRRQSKRTYTHPYEYTHANPTPRSIFEDCAGKSSRLTKSPQASRCQRERRLPLKAQTSLNPEKFAPTGSRTQDLRCYRALVTTRLQALSHI